MPLGFFQVSFKKSWIQLNKLNLGNQLTGLVFWLKRMFIFSNNHCVLLVRKVYIKQSAQCSLFNLSVKYWK